MNPRKPPDTTSTSSSSSGTPDVEPEPAPDVEPGTPAALELARELVQDAAQAFADAIERAIGLGLDPNEVLPVAGQVLAASMGGGAGVELPPLPHVPEPEQGGGSGPRRML